MLDIAVFRTGVRYGVIGALVGMALLFVIFLTGNNPYGANRFYTFAFIPIFIFLGVRYFKKFRSGDLSFFKAFSVAFSISLYLAVVSGMLLYIFSAFAGYEVMQQYIQESKAMLEATRTQMVESWGEDIYNQNLMVLEQTTPELLAFTDFMNKLFVGVFCSLLAAVFFRK